MVEEEGFCWINFEFNEGFFFCFVFVFVSGFRLADWDSA